MFCVIREKRCVFNKIVLGAYFLHQFVILFVVQLTHINTTKEKISKKLGEKTNIKTSFGTITIYFFLVDANFDSTPLNIHRIWIKNSQLCQIFQTKIHVSNI